MLSEDPVGYIHILNLALLDLNALLQAAVFGLELSCVHHAAPLSRVKFQNGRFNKFVAARAGSGRNAISVDTLGNKVCCTESRESLAIGDISKQYWVAYRTVWASI
jgi:hypothetical protein